MQSPQPVTCPRCGGSGRHIAHPRQQTGMVCFKCGGSGVVAAKPRRGAVNPEAWFSCYDCGSSAQARDLQTVKRRRLCAHCIAQMEERDQSGGAVAVADCAGV